MQIVALVDGVSVEAETFASDTTVLQLGWDASFKIAAYNDTVR
jgi:hypothetical protein